MWWKGIRAYTSKFFLCSYSSKVLDSSLAVRGTSPSFSIFLSIVAVHQISIQEVSTYVPLNKGHIDWDQPSAHCRNEGCPLLGGLNIILDKLSFLSSSQRVCGIVPVQECPKGGGKKSTRLGHTHFLKPHPF